MENSFNIPEKFKLADELKAILSDVLNVITIDRMFLSSKQTEGTNSFYFITAIIDINVDPVPPEFITLASKITKESPFKIRIFTEEHVDSELQRGSFYFLEHCCAGQLIYASGQSENIALYEQQYLNGYLRWAIKHYKVERKKIDSFLKSADLLISENQLNVAAFNLHQSFELSFRFIERMFLGKSKVTHSIISHCNYCKPFLSNLIPFHLEEQNELLVLLDHAYTASRYENEYEISEKQIHKIRSELILFLEKIDALYKKRLETCKELKNNYDEIIVRRPNLSTASYNMEQQLLSILKQEADLHAVYLFELSEYTESKQLFGEIDIKDSDKTFIYTILIVSNSPIKKNIGDFMDILYKKTQHKCQVFPVCYSLQHIKHRVDEGDNFLTRILITLPCIWQENDDLQNSKRYNVIHHPQIYKRIEHEWNIRIQKAASLLSFFDTDFELEPTVTLAALYFAVEQVCLGILYLFWEFNPTHHSLKYLLHLCSLCTDIPKSFFLANNYQAKRILYILSHAHHSMRFKRASKITPDEIENAITVCETFYKEAVKVGEQQLAKIKAIHFNEIDKS